MEQISLTCLGVGDGGPCADRFHSSSFYDWNGCRVLIDCGEPVCHTYKGTGRSFDALDAVLVSHFHFDHFGGFFMLMQGCWLEGRRRPLPVHLPAHGIPAIQEMLRTGYLFDELLPFELQFVPLHAHGRIDLGDLTITPMPSSHLKRLEQSYGRSYPGRYDCYSFLLESDGRRVYHTADLGAPSDLDEALKNPLDVLVCELAHFQPEALFARLRGTRIGQVILTHVGRPYWDRLDHVRALAQKILPDWNIRFARDRENYLL